MRLDNIAVSTSIAVQIVTPSVLLNVSLQFFSITCQI